MKLKLAYCELILFVSNICAFNYTHKKVKQRENDYIPICVLINNNDDNNNNNKHTAIDSMVH